MPCFDCPDGWACPDATNSENNVKCSKLGGHYGFGTLQTKCKVCEPGYYCPIDEEVPIPCLPGQYSLGGATMCTSCPAGYQCPSTSRALMQRCSLGTYSTGAQEVCTQCPPGYGCDALSTYPCPSGMISELGDGRCRYYSAAEYSSTINNDLTVTFLYCAEGEYKMFGMQTCVACPIGHYCPSKTNLPIVCSPGTYSDQLRSTACLPCAAGYYSVFG